MHTSNNDIRLGNVGPLESGKEQASNRTNIHYKELSMLSITYTDSKTDIWVREKAKTLLKKSEDGSGPGQLECDVVQGVSRCGVALTFFRAL